MQSPSSATRVGVSISVVGCALVILGFFFPLFSRHYPDRNMQLVYQWGYVAGMGGALLILDLLVVLFVLGASVAVLLRKLPSELVFLKRGVALGGLLLQASFGVLVRRVLSLSCGLWSGVFCCRSAVAHPWFHPARCWRISWQQPSC